MKFKNYIVEKTRELSLQGHIVLAPVICSEKEGIQYHMQLIKLHKKKIDISDMVFVINVGGYIGNSVKEEIAYSHSHGVPVEYMKSIESLKEDV